MQNYNYQKQLKEIWDKSVRLYQEGTRGAENYFNEEELTFLSSIGHSAQEVYDFAEDFVSSEEPDFETFALVADKRRNYFLIRQKGNASNKIVDTEELPPKDEAVEGIVWLPRILEKAKAKLKGEMNPDLMYGCGGDRRFFKKHDIHPAEFLALVEALNEDNEAVISYFVNRPSTVKDEE